MTTTVRMRDITDEDRERLLEWRLLRCLLRWVALLLDEEPRKHALRALVTCDLCRCRRRRCCTSSGWRAGEIKEM